MVKRNYQDFLTEYAKYSDFTEAPERFVLWSAITGIAAVLGRKCYINFSPTIRPTIYTILIAESGKCRKSTSINQFTNLIAQLPNPPLMLAQKMTCEGLIKAIREGNATEAIDPESGKISLEIHKNATCEGFIVAPELVTLINGNSIKGGLIDILTDFWDANDQGFEYFTSGRGSEHVNKPFLCMLAATTTTWMRKGLTEESIMGGFMGRVLPIPSPPNPKLFPFPEKNDHLRRREENLVCDLSQIATLEGAFTLTKDAKQHYSSMYVLFHRESPLMDDPLLGGYCSRRMLYLLKVSMVLSASRGNSMEIDATDIRIAEKLLLTIEPDLPNILRSISATEGGEMLLFIMSIVGNSSKGMVTRTEMMRRVQHKLKAFELDEYIATLAVADRIKVKETGGSILYHMNDEQKKLFMNT